MSPIARRRAAATISPGRCFFMIALPVSLTLWAIIIYVLLRLTS